MSYPLKSNPYCEKRQEESLNQGFSPLNTQNIYNNGYIPAGQPIYVEAPYNNGQKAPFTALPPQQQNFTAPLLHPAIIQGSVSHVDLRKPGKVPINIPCPNCNVNVRTITEPKTGLLTWVSSIFLCSLGLCCLPFCVESLKDTEHSCPACGATVALHTRM